MFIKRLGYIVATCCLLAIAFYLGYLFSVREQLNFVEDRVDVTNYNGSKKNFLTQIERRSIFGIVDNKKPQIFGELLFIQEEGNTTQILINLQSVPLAVKSSDNKEKAIPTELNIALATKTSDGLDFDYENTGKIIFNSPDKNRLRDAKFFTTIPKHLYNAGDPAKSIQRIEMKAINPEDENIFSIDNSDLPIKVRQRRAPYFWVNI